MKIKLFYILIFFLFNIISFGCVKKERKVKTEMCNCQIFFKDFGFRDFKLDTEKSVIFAELISLERINKNIASVDHYLYYEKSKILDVEINVEYIFKFENEILVGYFFEIINSLEFYEELVKEIINKNENKFVGMGSAVRVKLRNIDENENCLKYFQVKQRGRKLIITGGVRKVK